MVEQKKQNTAPAGTNKPANKPGGYRGNNASKGPGGYQGNNSKGGYQGKNDNRDGQKGGGKRGGKPGGRRDDRQAEQEFDQKIVDLARVTRVMAGGKRMRFRACLVLGDHKGKVGVGLAKGVDVTAAITKAVNKAKKTMITVPIAKGTIPHEVKHKFGASLLLIKPASEGRGIIAGGVVRVVAEMAGIHNMTGKILGTGNNVANAKGMMEALAKLRWTKATEKKQKPAEATKEEATEVQEVAE